MKNKKESDWPALIMIIIIIIVSIIILFLILFGLKEFVIQVINAIKS